LAKIRVAAVVGIKDQLATLQQWCCRITKKTLIITEECRGLQPSIDVCDPIMRDKTGSHYLHFSENINILPRCFNHAKHVFPMSSLVHSLKAIQVTSVATNANILAQTSAQTVWTEVSAATLAILKQRETGAGVGVCNVITSVLLVSMHKKSKEAAMSVINIERIFRRNPYASSNRSDKRGGVRSLRLCSWIRETQVRQET
jgi:hypothetical protein